MKTNVLGKENDLTVVIEAGVKKVICLSMIKRLIQLMQWEHRKR